MNNRKKPRAGDRRKRRDQPTVLGVAEMRALGSPLRLELFQRIAAGTDTATTLAAAMALPVTRLYHHLRLLTEAGLIEIAAETKKRGTIERSYRPANTGLQLDPIAVAGKDGTGGPGAAPVRAALRMAEAGLVAMASNPELSTYGLLEQELVRLTPRTARRFRERLDRLLEELREADLVSGEIEVLLTVALAARKQGSS